MRLFPTVLVALVILGVSCGPLSAADPGELHNLANAPAQASRIAQMHAALVKEIGEDPEVTEQRCRTEMAKGYPDAGDGKRGKGKKRANRQ